MPELPYMVGKKRVDTWRFQKGFGYFLLTFIVVVAVFVVVVGNVDVLVVQFVFGLPGHLVFFFQPSPCIGKPGTNLKRVIKLALK